MIDASDEVNMSVPMNGMGLGRALEQRNSLETKDIDDGCGKMVGF